MGRTFYVCAGSAGLLALCGALLFFAINRFLAPERHSLVERLDNSAAYYSMIDDPDLLASGCSSRLLRIISHSSPADLATPTVPVAWVDRDSKKLHFWLLADEFSPVYAKLTANDGESEVIPIPDKERMKNLRRDYAGAVYKASLPLLYRFPFEKLSDLEELLLLDKSGNAVARGLINHGSDCDGELDAVTGADGIGEESEVESGDVSGAENVF